MKSAKCFGLVRLDTFAESRNDDICTDSTQNSRISQGQHYGDSTPSLPSLRGSEATEAIHLIVNIFRNAESIKFMQILIQNLQGDSTDSLKITMTLIFFIDCHSSKGLRNNRIIVFL